MPAGLHAANVITNELFELQKWYKCSRRGLAAQGIAPLSQQGPTNDRSEQSLKQCRQCNSSS